MEGVSLVSHGVWQAWLDAYAEGQLNWPFTWLVEAHTRRCHKCCEELRIQLSMMRQLDELVFTREEVVTTAYRTTLHTLEEKHLTQHRTQRRYVPLALAGATAFLIMLTILPIGINNWFAPGVTVVAASSWSEGVATSIPIEEDAGEVGLVLTNSSGVGKGTGIAISVSAIDEWGG